jgi:hypothetical protein
MPFSRSDGHHRRASDSVNRTGCFPETMLYLAQDLGTIPGSRKVIVYFGDGLIVPQGLADDCGAAQTLDGSVRYRATTAREHQSINTIGLVGGRNAQLINDDYLTVANETGGRAVINSNSFDEGIARIFAENDSYYLLAYQPTKRRGRRSSSTCRRESEPARPGGDRHAQLLGTQGGQARRDRARPGAGRISRHSPQSCRWRNSHCTRWRRRLPPRAAAPTIALAVRLDQPAFAVRTPETVDLLVVAQSSDGPLERLRRADRSRHRSRRPCRCVVAIRGSAAP